MLKIAVPNKGSLAETAAWMLDEAGYRGRRDGKELIVVDARNEVEFFFLRPRDIATYVGSGALDVGITGRDLLLDSGAHASEAMALGFGASTFRFAVRHVLEHWTAAAVQAIARMLASPMVVRVRQRERTEDAA